MTAAELAKFFEGVCDTLDRHDPPEDVATSHDLLLQRLGVCAKRVVEGLDLPSHVKDQCFAKIDDFVNRKRFVVAEWLVDAKRSRRGARILGRCFILSRGYVTTGETNWLNDPEKIDNEQWLRQRLADDDELRRPR